MHLHVSDLSDIDKFKLSFSKFDLNMNTVYSTYIKIRYNINHFFMAGHQFGFNYLSDDDLLDLYDNIILRLEEYFGKSR